MKCVNFFVVELVGLGRRGDSTAFGVGPNDSGLAPPHSKH
jgi:hypothetical protein